MEIYSFSQSFLFLWIVFTKHLLKARCASIVFICKQQLQEENNCFSVNNVEQQQTLCNSVTY